MKLFIWKTSLNSVVMVWKRNRHLSIFAGIHLIVENRNIIKIQTRFQFESWSWRLNMANCEASANSQAAMLRLKDELSDDEKNGNIGKIITYIPDLCQTGWSFREAYQNLGKLSTLDRHLEKVGRMLDNMTRDRNDSSSSGLPEEKLHRSHD